jgi:hypothetical protein
LKWFDLNHLLKIKHEMLDCAPPPNIPVLMNECLVLAQSFAGQTEAISEDGSLLYLQDTSATHLSSFGLVIYKVGHTYLDVETGGADTFFYGSSFGGLTPDNNGWPFRLSVEFIKVASKSRERTIRR